MTLVKLINEYLDGEKDAITTIRILSGIFNPDHMMTILTLICQITRHAQGDLDTETFRRVYLKRD